MGAEILAVGLVRLDGPESVGISGSGESEDELIVRVLDIKAVDTLIGNTVGE
jgi:hypothetical protein